MLKYLKHNEIIKAKWDNCVRNAVNPLLYNTSSYLDIIHPEWEAYVFEQNNQYLAVMPLLSSSKARMKIHLKPILAQQLGISYLPEFEIENGLKEIIGAINSQFRLIEYPLNSHNLVNEKTVDGKLSIEHCATQTLALNKPYHQIKSNYRRDRKSRLNQAVKRKLQITDSTDIQVFLKLFSENVIPKIYGGVNADTITRIGRLIEMGIKDGTGHLFLATDQTSLALSGGYFTFFQGRLTYLFGATSDPGKSVHANTFLLDFVIQAFVGKADLLDFEGSSVEGIRDFYKSFGSQDENFILLKNENLPPVLKAVLASRKKIHQLLNS